MHQKTFKSGFYGKIFHLVQNKARIEGIVLAGQVSFQDFAGIILAFAESGQLSILLYPFPSIGKNVYITPML